jgi:hypothetical protein
MRWKLLLAALFTCFAGSALTQNISGSWQGTLHGRADSRSIVKIDKTRDGSWSANLFNLESPDRGSRIPASSVSVEGRSINIAFDEIGATYEGTANDAGTWIAGIWAQNDGPGVFNLQKATPATIRMSISCPSNAARSNGAWGR